MMNGIGVNRVGTTRPVVTICGSMRFFNRMVEVAAEETMNGSVVLLPFCIEDPESIEKEMLDKMHLDKIDMSDGIVVVALDGYVGESTRKEISHAARTRKPIYRWVTELP